MRCHTQPGKTQLAQNVGLVNRQMRPWRTLMLEPAVASDWEAFGTLHKLACHEVQSLMACRQIALTEAALVLRVGALKTRKFELGDDSRARTDTHEAPAPPECAVCLVAFESGEKIKTLPCGHEFHLKCVDAWMLAKKPAVVGDGTLPKPRPTCPLCKADPFAAQDRKVQEAISVTRLS